MLIWAESNHDDVDMLTLDIFMSNCMNQPVRMSKNKNNRKYKLNAIGTCCAYCCTQVPLSLIHI